MGLSRLLDFVSTQTLQTSPSSSGTYWMSLPMTQEFCGDVSSTSKTMYPGIKFLDTRDHFRCFYSSSKYSLMQCFRNRSAMYWTASGTRQLQHVYTSSFWKSTEGRDSLASGSRRWFGVSISSSFGFLKSVVRGWLFIMASASQKNICRLSWSRLCVLNVALLIFLMDQVKRSQTSIWWESVGGLNIIPLFFVRRKYLLSWRCSCLG